MGEAIIEPTPVEPQPSEDKGREPPNVTLADKMRRRGWGHGV